MAVRSRIRPDHAQVLVVDVQARLTPHIREHESVVAQIVRTLRAARELALPATVTEQYPSGLGPTEPTILAETRDAPRFEKTTFSVWADEGCRTRITSLHRPVVMLVGIETHVCVQQTALDLLADGMEPWLLVDAVGSRREVDRATAVERMRHAGVTVTTVESCIYELMERAGTELFKRMLPIVR
ncbi:MAG: hydrolase [Phycisphaerae bacterium]